MAFRIHLLFVYILLCLFSLYHANANVLEWPKQPNNVGFSWGNCGPDGQPIRINSLSISPDPIKLPGNVVISVSVNLTKPFPSDLSAIVVMKKKILGIFITIPCEHNVGSCTYRDLCTNMTQVFPKFLGTYDASKKCPPIPPATYSVSNLVVDVTKSLPSIADGEFHITIDFLSNSAGQLGCLQLDLNLTG